VLIHHPFHLPGELTDVIPALIETKDDDVMAGVEAELDDIEKGIKENSPDAATKRDMMVSGSG
jgi:hypothetical protein